MRYVHIADPQRRAAIELHPLNEWLRRTRSGRPHERRTIDGSTDRGLLSYLDKVGRKTPRTIVDVRCTLRRAIEGLEQHRPGVDLWRLSAGGLSALAGGGASAGRTDRSLAKYLSHLRGLLDYAWRSGRSERNVLDGFSSTAHNARTAPKHLTLEEAERLVRAALQRGPTARRDRLVILLLYGCGLRTNELCCARRGSDITANATSWLCSRPRAIGRAAIPIPDALYTELLAYLLERGKRGALFRTTAQGTTTATKDVCDIVRDAVRTRGLRADITARTLRHSFATHLMDRGVDLAIIASLMGHRSPQETGVYLHVLPAARSCSQNSSIGGTS